MKKTLTIQKKIEKQEEIIKMLNVKGKPKVQSRTEEKVEMKKD